jgi:gliding motility-associated-like protein
LNNPNIGNPVATPSTPGLYNYRVIGTDNKSCFADTALVSVLIAPLPTFNITDSFITMNVGSTYKIPTSNSPDVVTWLWTPSYGLSCSNCAEPVAQPRGNTTYTAKAFTSFGCTASDNITFEVICNNANVFIPNTFSPNNDSKNDYFYPQGKGLFTIKSLRIFNRWGIMVFVKTNFGANNPTEGWDGRYNGQDQPSDVYVYVMDVLCENGTVLSYKGNVTLIR